MNEDGTEAFLENNDFNVIRFVQQLLSVIFLQKLLTHENNGYDCKFRLKKACGTK